MSPQGNGKSSTKLDDTFQDLQFQSKNCQFSLFRRDHNSNGRGKMIIGP